MIIRRLRTPMRTMDATMIAKSLECHERNRVSSLKVARQRLASRLRVGIGTLENIIRARVKTVDSEIRDRLQNLLVRELEGELARLQHELQVARQGGARLDSDQVSAVETYLAKARALLAGETESNPDTEEGS